MAVWSKALPLKVSCFSPLPWFESRPGHVKKLPVTWRMAMVSAWDSGFLHHSIRQLANHDRTLLFSGRKSDYNENFKFYILPKSSITFQSNLRDHFRTSKSISVRERQKTLKCVFPTLLFRKRAKAKFKYMSNISGENVRKKHFQHFVKNVWKRYLHSFICLFLAHFRKEVLEKIFDLFSACRVCFLVLFTN